MVKSRKSGIIKLFALFIMIMLFSIAISLFYISSMNKVVSRGYLEKIKVDMAVDSVLNYAVSYLKTILQKDKRLLVKSNMPIFKGNKLFHYHHNTITACNYTMKDRASKTDKRFFILGNFSISIECLLKSNNRVLARSNRYHIIDVLDNIEITDIQSFTKFTRKDEYEGWNLSSEFGGFLISKVRKFKVEPYFSLDEEGLRNKRIVIIPLTNILPYQNAKIGNKKVSVSNFNLLIIFNTLSLESYTKTYTIFETKEEGKDNNEYEFKLFYSDSIKKFFPFCSGFQVIFGKDWPFGGVKNCILSTALTPANWHNFLISVNQLNRRFIAKDSSVIRTPYTQLLEIWINGKKDYLSLLTADYDMNRLSKYYFDSSILENNISDNIDKKKIILNNTDVKIVGLFVFEGRYTKNILSDIKSKGIFENYLTFTINYPHRKSSKVLDVYVGVSSSVIKNRMKYKLDDHRVEIFVKSPIFEPIIVDRIEFIVLKRGEILE